ncbi:FAD-dependent oxidoreductase [Alphaproteobacteria bacterium]|nr:FAD-dependent oxidoreductase [Alphaproteobacteria bacterium]
MKKLFILGAGSSGLGAAFALKDAKKIKTVVYEKSSKPGGLAGSFEWNDHIIDYGPHRLSPNLKRVVGAVKLIMGDRLETFYSDHGVQIGDRVFKFPPLLSQWLRFDAFIWAGRVFFSVVMSKFKFQKRAGNNFTDLMRRRFGSFFYEEVIHDMCSKVWISPDLIDKKFADERFSLLKPVEIIRAFVLRATTRNPGFVFYPTGGYQQIWNEMAKVCTKGQTTLNFESELTETVVENNVITSISVKDLRSNKIKIIDTIDNHILSTIPILSLVSSMETSDKHLLAVQQLVKKIKMRSMVLFCAEFDGENTLPHRTMIFPSKDVIFNRLFEQNKYSLSTVVPGKSVIVADITCDFLDGIYRVKDDVIKSLVQDSLDQLEYLNNKPITNWHVKRIPFAYMVPDVESRSALRNVVSAVQRIKNIDLIGRFSVGEYDNSDYAIQNGFDFAEFFLSNAYKNKKFEVSEFREIVN